MSNESSLLATIRQGRNKYSRSSRVTKIKEGKTRIRILRDPTEDKFWRDLGVHWIKTEADGKAICVVGCADHIKEQPCVICTALSRAAKATTEDRTLKLIKDMGVRKTVLVNALVRDGADANENDPVILELSTTAFNQILSNIDEYLSSDINVLDPATGMDFMVERRGRNMDTEYTVVVAPKSNPVNIAVLKKLHDIDAYIEKEYFKGDEKKAINAIAGLVGDMTILSLAGPRSGAAAALTSAVVDGADVGGDAALRALEALEAPASVAPAVAAVETVVTTPVAASVTPASDPKPAAVAPTSAEADDDVLRALEALTTG